MKKILLLAFVAVATILNAQPWTEDFETHPSTTYAAPSVTINGRVWTKHQAGNFSYANTSMGSYAFTINDDKAGAHITTPALNTCGSVSFKYAYKNGLPTAVFHLQRSYDGTTFYDVSVVTLTAAADENYISTSFTLNDPASTIYLRILSDDQKGHLFIDDFSVTAFTPTAVTGVTLNHATLDVPQGSTANLVANVLPADATNTNVSWATADASIATVSSTGEVTGVALGTTNITVTTEDGGFTKTCVVTVSAPIPPSVPVSNWAILLSIAGVIGFSLLRFVIRK